MEKWLVGLLLTGIHYSYSHSLLCGVLGLFFFFEDVHISTVNVYKVIHDRKYSTKLLASAFLRSPARTQDFTVVVRVLRM